MSDIYKEVLKKEIAQILKNADLNTTSARNVRNQLEEKFDADLRYRKKEVDLLIMDAIDGQTLTIPDMTPLSSKVNKHIPDDLLQREDSQIGFIKHMIEKNLQLWEGLRNEFIAMRRFGNSSKDHQSDETPSSPKKRTADRNEDNADKEPPPTKRRKGGTSETSKKCNNYEKGTAINKSKIAHNKKGIITQDMPATHKEKYRGGISESEMRPNKDTRLKKDSKGSSSTSDIAPTIGKSCQKRRKELVDHMEDFMKSLPVPLVNLPHGIGKLRKIGDAQEFGEKTITSVNKTIGITGEMKKQKIHPTGPSEASTNNKLYAFRMINNQDPPSDPPIQQIKPKLRDPGSTFHSIGVTSL